MFCSCRISTHKCLARSLCNSRATCLSMPRCIIQSRSDSDVTRDPTFQTGTEIRILVLVSVWPVWRGAGIVRDQFLARILARKLAPWNSSLTAERSLATQKVRISAGPLPSSVTALVKPWTSSNNAITRRPCASCSHPCASVTKQYNLVPAYGR